MNVILYKMEYIDYSDITNMKLINNDKNNL